jgi:hypothetical protein
MNNNHLPAATIKAEGVLRALAVLVLLGGGPAPRTAGIKVGMVADLTQSYQAHKHAHGPLQDGLGLSKKDIYSNFIFIFSVWQDVFPIYF